MPAATPVPTPILRLMHVDCLPTILARDALHAPNNNPSDGLPYRAIHSVAVQATRRVTSIPCGPGGTVHDYLPFYFGPLSPMLLVLKNGGVPGYTEGQGPLIYVVSTVEAVIANNHSFVFSDGHGLANFTQWYDDPAMLGQVDWGVVGAKYWGDTAADNDKKRRKQAEFLVWQSLPWTRIQRIVTANVSTKLKVESILNTNTNLHKPSVLILQNWYY